MAAETPFDHPIAALERQAAVRGAAEALSFPHDGARVSFAQWHDEAMAMARGLAALGLGAGDHIALVAENRREWPIVQMGVAALGAVFVPLNTHCRRDDLEIVLRRARARAVITVAEFRGNPYLEHIADARTALPHLDHVVVIGGGDGFATYDALVQAQGPLPERALDPGAVAVLLFTSGTTGTPKGALLSHRATMMNARTTAARLGIVAGDRWTSIIPLFHCAGCIMNALGCLQTGATYVGVPSFDPVTMFETIEAERCTVLSGVPTSYLAMLEHPRRSDFDLSSLRAGTCGGADCNPDILQACAREFPMPGLAQVYGQTETATLVACPAHDDPRRFATAGPPLPGHETRIVDPKSGAVLPAGEVGEIQARGPMVMQGYFEMRRETAETLDADGWLHTGDLGYLRRDGHLVIAGGRLRDMIIRGGENIYPVEIENLLQQHPAVERIAVFGMADAYYGERVAAAVVLGAPATAADLQGFCDGRLARFKVPVEIYATETFPLTPSGKVRKVALREQAVAGGLRRLE